MDNKTILQIPFTTLFQKEILEKIRASIGHQSRPLFIATPNPEMLLECQKNPKFLKILQTTDLNLPDGNGIIWASKFTNKLWPKPFLALQGMISLIAFAFQPKNSSKRFNQALHGSDLTLQICQDPVLAKQGIFLLGNRAGLSPKSAELAATKLAKTYPDLKISGYYDSTPDDPESIAKINQSQAKILLVGFGAPKQEMWIAEHLKNLPHLKMAMGVGGTFDFIAGILPRAPSFMRKIGLEWLYRLYKQPKRIKRIYNATIVFPIKVIAEKLANPDKHKTSDT